MRAVKHFKEKMLIDEIFRIQKSRKKVNKHVKREYMLTL